MNNIIDFPSADDKKIEQAVNFFGESYKDAGLSPDQVDFAVSELEPIFRQILGSKNFEFKLDGPFDQEQYQLIEEAHSETMQEAINFSKEKMRLAMLHIVRLIGRHAKSIK